MQTINLLISSIIQALLFTLIPFIWWMIVGRKEQSFFKWLGFKKIVIKDKTKYFVIFVMTMIILLLPSVLIVPFFIDESTMATARFAGKGMSVIIPALIYSFLQTSFSEELFFRGFLTKRLIHRFSFGVGNVIQGLVFGIMHGLMFFSIAGLKGAIIVTLLTTIVGYSLGWINEKQSNGSIISSWLLHGCANTVASMIAMFNIL